MYKTKKRIVLTISGLILFAFMVLLVLLVTPFVNPKSPYGTKEF